VTSVVNALTIDNFVTYLQFLEADSLADLTREYIYTLQSVQQLTATVWQIKQIRSQVCLL